MVVIGLGKNTAHREKILIIILQSFTNFVVVNLKMTFNFKISFSVSTTVAWNLNMIKCVWIGKNLTFFKIKRFYFALLPAFSVVVDRFHALLLPRFIFYCFSSDSSSGGPITSLFHNILLKNDSSTSILTRIPEDFQLLSEFYPIGQLLSAF